MKRVLKLLTTVLLILIVVSLAAAVMLWYFLPKEKIGTVITKELSSRLKQEITMSEFSVGFRPRLEFVAYDMRIVDPLTSQEILAARRVWFDLNVRELFNRRCVIEDITFDSAVLNLVRDAHGAWNVEKVIESVRSTKQTDATQPVSWLEFGQIFINYSSIGIDDKLTGQQLSVNGLTATVDVRKGILAINSASVVSPFIEAELSGTISQFVQLNPVFDIRARLHITREGPFAKILPGTVPSGAKIAEVSLNASGHSTEIALDATFSLNPLITADTSTKGTIQGTLRVKEGYFNIDILKASFGQSTLSLSGTCDNIWQQERAAHIKGTASIALEEALALTGKDLVATLDPKGSADATIALNGSMAQIDLETTINLLNAGVTIPRVMRKQKNTPAMLVVAAQYDMDNTILIDTLELMIDDAKPEGKGQVKPKNEPWFKIALSGTCDNIWQQERAAHIKGTASIALEEALALTGKDLIAALDPKGSADATIALNGSMAQIDLETTINLLNAGFTIPQVMRKETNTPGTLIVDAKHDMGHAFLIDNFELTLDNARIEGNVQVTPKNEPWFKTTFTTSGFPLMHLDRFPSVRFKDGTLTLTGEVWQETPSHKDLHYRGNATIEQATLIAQLLKEPVRDLDARIEIADQHADLPSASFAVGESCYQLQAEVSGFSVPRITGRLYTDALDINEIVSAFAKQKPGGKKTTSSKTPTRPNFSIELLIEADAMCAGKFRTGAVSTIWHTSGRIQEFYPIAIDAYRGNLRGGFYLALLGNNTYWVSDFSGQNMNLEVVVDHLLEETIKGDVKNGLLSMEGTLSGVASRKREDVWKSLDGELKVRMIDGEIKKSPMFNSIMLATQLPVSVLLTSKAFSVNSLLETAKTRGRTLLDNPVIFKKIEGAFRIDTGVAHTEDLYFEGKTADILFRGDLNLVNEQIDMRISVAPIGPTGSILRKVPAIGKRMDRSIKSIFSLSFIAQGSISNPGLRLSTVDTLKPMRRKK